MRVKHRRFSKLLVANRGEIACRILRSAHAEGLRSAALYSAADHDALHVRLAHEAHPIGGAAAADSYLRGEAIVALAQRIGADAIHPGYGFLAEQPSFAEACHAAGLVFVGPSAQAMRALGNKSAARRLARTLGIPIRPGYEGDEQSDEELEQQARAIGYPLMVKAAGGGGGRGMRIVRRESELHEALAGARAEAQAGFGSAHLLLEVLCEKARHIEIQILADSHGTTLSLHERDCSTQRRHQKIIEEAPAAGLPPALRDAMSRDAIRLARAVDYQGAGTVEFLLEPEGRYTLLEMNTRLQVEHPVTELITGLDLVALQLRIAQGEALAIDQDQVRIHGHAVEVRLCAEDPERGWMPQTGPVHALRWPQLEGVRVDHGLHPGCSISPHYDPMMAKIIAWGTDRRQAIARLRTALEQLRLLGPRDNRQQLHAALAHPGFTESSTSDVGWLERACAVDPSLGYAAAAPAAAPAADPAAAPAADPKAHPKAHPLGGPGPSGPHTHWYYAAGVLIADRSARAHGSLAGFQSTARPGEAASLISTMRIRAQRHQHSMVVRLCCEGLLHTDPAFMRWLASDASRAEADWVPVLVSSGATFSADPRMPASHDASGTDRSEELRIGATRYTFLAHWSAEGLHLDLGHTTDLAQEDLLPGGTDTVQDREGTVRSSMHGLVASVEAAVGAQVCAGSLLLRIEAMKIQHRIEAPHDGVVTSITVQAGQQVSAGQVLAVINPQAPTPSTPSVLAVPTPPSVSTTLAGSPEQADPAVPAAPAEPA